MNMQILSKNVIITKISPPYWKNKDLKDELKNLYNEMEWLQFAMDIDETNFEISKILYSGHVDSKRTD